MSKKQTLDDEISLTSCEKAPGINQVRDEVNLAYCQGADVPFSVTHDL